MAAVFPEQEYQLQQITPGHPLWRMQELVRPDSPYVGPSKRPGNRSASEAS
jgi:hypothetical protein